MPSGGKRDVDALWQQLRQQETLSKDKDRLESLWRNVQSGTQRHIRSTKPLWQQQQQPGQQPSKDSSSEKSLDAFKSGIKDGSAVAQLKIALQSHDTYAVKKALQQLKAALADVEIASAVPSAKLCKALLRSFDNRTEACRDMAVSCLTLILQVDPDSTLSLLPYVMPVLVERMQCDEGHNLAEVSEEVRLKLVQLLCLVMGQAGSAVAAYASEVWTILTAVLRDSFYEVAMQGCKAAQQLAGALGLRLGATSKELVAALLPLTTHQRYRVRVAAIEAIRDVMHQGAHEMILEMVAWRDPNVVPISAFYGDDIKVNFFGKLATDRHVQVRLAFLDMVGNWMLTLRERRDHEPRLLPYVLSGMCDESPAVVDAALQILDQLGQQYEQEHEKDLADQLRFASRLECGAEAQLLQCIQSGTVCYAGCWDAQMADAAAAAGSPAAGTGSRALTDMQQELMHTVASSSTGQAAAAGGSAAGDSSGNTGPVFVLPGPLKQRARLGSRLLVRNNMSCLLPALCRELSSWQSCPRAKSAQLLLVSLLMAEAAAEQHLQVILPALCAAVCDAEAGSTVKACGTVLGAFCSLPLLLDLLEPRLQDWADVPQRQAGGLSLLAAVLQGAGPMQRVRGHGIRLLQLLTDLDLASCQDSSIRAAMTQLAQQLVVPYTLQQLSSNTSSDTIAGTVNGTTCSSSSSGSHAAAQCDVSRPASVVHSSPAAGSHSSDEPGDTEALDMLQQLLQDMLTVEGSKQSNAAAVDESCAGGQWLAAALERVRLSAC